MSETVKLERDKGVATLTLNRPDALNALTVEMKTALRDTLKELGEDPEVRAVVLTGAGRAFCAGQDLKEHITLIASGDPSPLSTVEEHYNPIVLSLATMPKPVIAAVNGTAAGAGASFSYACDFRIVARGAKFVMAFAKIALSVDSGGSWTLPRLIGQAKATELLLLGDPVDSARAHELGMVNEVIDDDALLARATELAQQLAAGPTLAYASIKSALHYSATHDLASSLANEGVHMTKAGGTEDHRNAVSAFLSKQPPTFVGR